MTENNPEPNSVESTPIDPPKEDSSEPTLDSDDDLFKKHHL